MNIAHHFCNHDAAHNNILHNTPPLICTSTTLFQSYSSIHIDLHNNTKDQSLFASAHQLQMSSLPLISCVSRQAPFLSALSFRTFHKNVQQYLYHQYIKNFAAVLQFPFPPFLPFASCTTSFSKDHFFVRKGSFSSSKLLPSSPSKSPFFFSPSLLPSAQNPKCTTTGLSNILLIQLNPLLFCLGLMIILSTRAFSSTNLCLLFLLLQFWSSFALQCARACHSTRSEQGGK